MVNKAYHNVTAYSQHNGLLLQPDHDFGTISQLKSVGLICRWTRSTKN